MNINVGVPIENFRLVAAWHCDESGNMPVAESGPPTLSEDGTSIVFAPIALPEWQRRDGCRPMLAIKFLERYIPLEKVLPVIFAGDALSIPLTLSQ